MTRRAHGPARVARVGPRDAPAIDAHGDQHVAAEGLGHGNALARAIPKLNARWPRRQVAEPMPQQRDALLNLTDAHPDPGVDVARGEHRHLEDRVVVWRIRKIAAAI